MRVVGLGVLAVAMAGCWVASGWIDAALLVLALGFAAVALLSPERRGWTTAGFFYAGSAEMASILVRLDQVYGFVALILILLVVWVPAIAGSFAPPAVSPPHASPQHTPLTPRRAAPPA